MICIIMYMYMYLYISYVYAMRQDEQEHLTPESLWHVLQLENGSMEAHANP